jgi:Ca-activated chloride channel family protein
MQMNVDDPILTAYALNELSEEEQARVAAEVAESPEAQRYVAEIQEFGNLLKTAYRAEEESEALHRINLLDIRADRWFWSIARPLSIAATIAVAALIAAIVFSSKYHGPARLAGMPVTIGTGERLSLPPAENTPSLDVQGEFVADDPGAKAKTEEKKELEKVVVAGSENPTAEEVGPGAAYESTDRTRRTAAAKSGNQRVLVARSGAGNGLDELKSANPVDTYRRDDIGSRGGRFSQSPTPAKRTAAADTPASAEAEFTERIGGIARQPSGNFNTAAYDHIVENPFLDAKTNPLSTFSIDVDTASYSNIRRFINEGQVPPKDAVRLEEMINYFTYDYPQPNDGKPFSINVDVASCPWQASHRLVRVGLKGREIALDKRGASNLVFLLDVSGSMTPAERLPLIKQSMRLLVEKLTENDRVAIVIYAGASGLALPSTTGDHKDQIFDALDHLQAGGSTNGAEGIELAYKIAADNFIKGGVNRVILATDGDFNVGVTNQGDLIRLIEEKAKSGVFLSVLGVGTDNLKDSTMQKLADKGNGNYAYLDSLDEGRKVLVQQMNGTLVTIAKDVKIQVEFNPARVASYRLIGYEKRMLRKEDFNNDKVDAGEIGAGHTVTALYEVVPAGAGASSSPEVDPLKYSGRSAPDAAISGSNEILTVKLRHKAPDGDKSELTERALVDNGANFANAAPDLKFAAAVAEFGMLLRDSEHKGNGTLAAVLEWAEEGKGSDPNGYRSGFIELVRKAQSLSKG